MHFLITAEKTRKDKYDHLKYFNFKQFLCPFVLICIFKFYARFSFYSSNIFMLKLFSLKRRFAAPQLSRLFCVFILSIYQCFISRFIATIPKTFSEAKQVINTLKEEPDNDVKLKIYALFKQVMTICPFSLRHDFNYMIKLSQSIPFENKAPSTILSIRPFHPGIR